MRAFSSKGKYDWTCQVSNTRVLGPVALTYSPNSEHDSEERILMSSRNVQCIRQR